MTAEDRDTAKGTVRAYYAALRAGEPLAPFFASDGDASVCKFGIGESLFGADAVAEALAEQSRTTDEWSVESRRLAVTERECHAWFADEVRLAWTDADGDRRAFETRWSGTLESRASEWWFVTMHVSAPRER